VTPNGYTHIRILILQYLAVDRSFPYHLNIFNDIPINYTKGNLVNITQSSTATTFYENTINYTVLANTITTNFKQFGANLARNFVALYLSSIYNAGDSSRPVIVRFKDETTVINVE
jgi:hypothetical protein